MPRCESSARTLCGYRRPVSRGSVVPREHWRPGWLTAGSLPLGEHLLVARALDNRVGTFAAAETLRLLHEQGVPEGIRVVAVSTVQEEVGLRGAAMIAESLAPDVALVTDVTHATDSPEINHAKHGKCVLGGGPEVAIGSAMHPEVVRRLLASAGGQEIAIQRAATPWAFWNRYRCHLPSCRWNPQWFVLLADSVHAHHGGNHRSARFGSNQQGLCEILSGPYRRLCPAG